MKIVLVNQHYPPDAGATGKLAAQLARALARRGNEVTVLTGRPTYEEARGARAPRDEIRDGVRVLRLPLLPRLVSPRGRLLHYLSFAAALLLRGLFLPRPDVLLAFSSTPLFGGPAAALLARALGCPLAYVVQDVYPEVAVALGVMRPGRATGLARFLETCAWRAAAKVVVIGPELAEVARERGIEASRVAVIGNWVDPVEIAPADGVRFRREAGIGDDEFVVQYAGNIGRSQDLEAVIEAARLVEARTSPGPPVRFLFVGGGACAEELVHAAGDVPRVTFLPRQPEERLPEVLAAADLSLVPLRRGMTRWCVPSKVYSILASARPVGASLDADSEIARIVEGWDCGFRVDPEDPAALAAEILRLAGDRERASDLGRHGRRRAETRDSLERAVSDYEDLLEAIVRSRSGA